MKLDMQFYGEIRKVKDDSVVPDDEWAVFLASDNAFAEILPLYRNKCIELRRDQEQVQSINRMLDRVLAWRTAHPSRLKSKFKWKWINGIKVYDSYKDYCDG